MVHPRLRAAGWRGYWIDAASTLRMRGDAVIVLDPVNLPVMQAARERGIKDFIGGNCTVSLMLMAVGGLLRAGEVEWITAMTYQSASGAGAKHMRELLEQMGALHASAAALLPDPAAGILDIDRAVSAALGESGVSAGAIRRTARGEPDSLDRQGFGRRPEPRGMEGGRRGEQDHGNGGAARAGRRHLRTGERDALPLAGTDDQAQARYAARRDRAIARRRQPLGARGPNDRESSIRELSPAAVSGSMNIPIGRLRKLAMGGDYLSAFTVGDQLLWGAAEPLRRTMRFLLPHV